jgi:hypothetical protein
MAPVYTAVVAALGKAKEDGSFLIDRDLDVFGSVEKGAGEYIQYKEGLLEEKKAVVDKKRPPVVWRQMVRDQLYDPQDATDLAAAPFAIKIIEVLALAMFDACHTTAVKDYIEDGYLATSKQTAALKAKAAGGYRAGDALSESVFGLGKEVQYLYRGAAVASVAAITSAKKQHVFKPARAPVGLVERPRASSPAPAAAAATPTLFRLSCLTTKQHGALISMVRKRRAYCQKLDKTTILEQRELAFKRGEAAAAKLEEQLKGKMVKVWVHFDTQKPHSKGEVNKNAAALLKASNDNPAIKNKEAKATDYLWDIRLYVTVFGLTRFKITRKGKTAAELLAHLLEHLADDLVLPDEPALVAGMSKALKVLGSPTVQHLAGQAAAAVKGPALQAAARAEKDRRILKLNEAAAKRKEPGAAPRQRNRKTATRLPCPTTDDSLVGKAVEYGFGFTADVVEVQGSLDALVGRIMRKSVNGERSLPGPVRGRRHRGPRQARAGGAARRGRRRLVVREAPVRGDPAGEDGEDARGQEQEDVDDVHALRQVGPRPVRRSRR